MKKNDLIIYEISKDINIEELNNEQLLQLKDTIIYNININKLEEQVNNTILKLSGVTKPCFGADLNFIANDNQNRLELIHQLLYNFNIVKSEVKYLKRNKNNYYIDSEKVYGFLIELQDLVKSILKYSEFKLEEDLELERYLEEIKIKQLKEKEENSDE